MSSATTDVPAHYGDCAGLGADHATCPGRWDGAEAISALRRHLGEPDREPDQLSRDVIDWVRRDVPQMRRPGDTDPEAIYTRLAATAMGEAMFFSGVEATTQFGYGELVGGVPRWSLDRFVGLGCPWHAHTPRPGDVVADLGCGAGVDAAAAARLVGPGGSVVAIDRLPHLLTRTPEGDARRVRATALAVPLRSGSASMVVANGLPPLLGPRLARHVIVEVDRVLRPRGWLAFTTLVCGPDVPLAEVGADDLVDAVRCSKPLCAQYRQLLVDRSFEDVTVHPSKSPFVDGYRAGPVRAVVITARRSAAM
jgi:SAM-dependent methyltransferase